MRTRSYDRFFFFFNDTATTEIYTLSLHDALPIYGGVAGTEVVDRDRDAQVPQRGQVAERHGVVDQHGLGDLHDQQAGRQPRRREGVRDVPEDALVGEVAAGDVHRDGGLGLPRPDGVLEI